MSWQQNNRWYLSAGPALLAGLVLGLAFHLAFTGASGAEAAFVTNDEAEIRKLLDEAAANEQRRDPWVTARMLAEDFVRVGADGAVWDKAQTIAATEPPRDATILSVGFEDERIRFYGNTAVVTGLGVMRGRSNGGEEFVIRNRCLLVMVKSSGRWQVAALQQTRAR